MLYDFRVVQRPLDLALVPRSVLVVPPAGYTQQAAERLAIPEICPPALLAVLADIARRVATEQSDILPNDHWGE